MSNMYSHLLHFLLNFVSDQEPYFNFSLQAAMEEALVRILTPRRSIDILRDVHAAKEQKKPYVVVFVGVNGVGKSTNLAKVRPPHSCRSLFHMF